jgi:16S rRNA (guanine527-N7)-methyltransferase
VTGVEDWLRAVVDARGLTSLGLDAARAVLLEDALRAIPVVERWGGVIVDVGSGNGSPGIPVAHALPDREVVLLESASRRCDFLRLWAPPNARVVRGRAEEQATDWAGVALAKALAPPAVAAEWCLPLVRPGGAAVIWVGASADLEALRGVAARLAAEPTASPPGLAVIEKTGPTPPGFPRRAGVARKRPLA